MAKPHPDMNIKVAAFTVSEKSSNTKKLEVVGKYMVGDSFRSCMSQES